MSRTQSLPSAMYAAALAQLNNNLCVNTDINGWQLKVQKFENCNIIRVQLIFNTLHNTHPHIQIRDTEPKIIQSLLGKTALFRSPCCSSPCSITERKSISAKWSSQQHQFIGTEEHLQIHFHANMPIPHVPLLPHKILVQTQIISIPITLNSIKR